MHIEENFSCPEQHQKDELEREDGEDRLGDSEVVFRGAGEVPGRPEDHERRHEDEIQSADVEGDIGGLLKEKKKGVIGSWGAKWDYET
jgi:hypothetical protein